MMRMVTDSISTAKINSRNKKNLHVLDDSNSYYCEEVCTRQRCVGTIAIVCINRSANGNQLKKVEPGKWEND